jgi:hypothetical protein
MPFAEHLLEQAQHLANREKKRPRQASLRRAVSTAPARQSGECKSYIDSDPPPPPGPELDCMRHLHNVADTLFRAQQQRHTADYDNAKVWTRTKVLAQVQLISLPGKAIQEGGRRQNLKPMSKFVRARAAATHQFVPCARLARKRTDRCPRDSTPPRYGTRSSTRTTVQGWM